MEEEDYDHSDFSEEEQAPRGFDGTLFEAAEGGEFNHYPHAISLTPNDPLLGIFQMFQEKVLESPEEFNYNGELSELLRAQVLQGNSPEAVKQELEKYNMSLNSICGKFITDKEIFFRCLDCDLLKQKSTYIYALLCPDCFEYSNHPGHRILYELSDSGSSPICDCGDPYALKEGGFCSKHTNLAVDPEVILNEFPPKALEIASTSLRKAFYGMISIYELALKGPSELGERRNRFHELGSVLFSDLMGFCQELYSEINSGFIVILGKIFSQNLLEDHCLVWHDCNDTKNDQYDWSLNPDKPHPCKCSVLDNLLRVCNVMDRESQNILHKVLIECAKVNTFKLYLQERFIKYIPYFYSQSYTDNDQEDKINSKILSMKVQMYGSEDLCFHGVKSEYFDQHLHCVKRAVAGAFQINYEVYNTCIDLSVGIGYFLNLKFGTAKTTIDKLDLIKESLDILMQFETKFFYTKSIHFGLFPHDVDYSSLNCGLMTAQALLDLIENTIRAIFKFDKNVQKSYIKKIVEVWSAHFEITKAVKEGELAQSFNCVFERAMSFLLRFCIGGINQAKLSDFMKEYLPDSDPSKFAIKVVEDLLKSVGMIRYVHLTHNYTQGEIYSVYYYSNNLFFESDIVFIQTLMLLINKEDVFETLYKNFFNYGPAAQEFFNEPSDFKKDDRLREKALVMEDFLDFLIYIMTDENCLLNADFAEKDPQVPDHTFIARANKIFRRVATSVLSGHYWIEGNTIRKEIKHFLFVKDKEVELSKIFNQIAIIDKKNKKVRIKDDQVSKFDPYILYRRPNLMKQISNEVFQKSAGKTEITVDVVGGQSYQDYPEYLVQIQQKLFQSNLMKFIGKFIDQFTADLSSLLRPTLKIILLYLEHLHMNAKKNPGLLEDQIAQVFINNTFVGKLKEVVTSSNMKDCDACVQKIANVISVLIKDKSSKNIMEGEVEISPTKDKEEEKKEMARQKMNRMKEEFLRKQQIFSSKMVSESLEFEEEKSNEAAQQNKKIICQHCLEAIDDQKELFGTPTLLTFSNNMHRKDDSSFGKVDEKPYYDRFPILSSCFHYYHEKCFKVWFDNTKKTNGVAKILRPFESLCPVCKQIFNAFVPFNRQVQQAEIGEQAEAPMYYTLEVAFEKLFAEWQTVMHLTDEKTKPDLFKDLAYKLLFRVLDECSKIEDQDKFTKFIALHKQALDILLDSIPRREQDDNQISLFAWLHDEWKWMSNDHDLLTSFAFRVLLTPKKDTQQIIQQITGEYFLFKTAQQKILAQGQPENLIQFIKGLENNDYEHLAIMSSLSSFLGKVQVLEELVKNYDHTQESNLKNLHNRISNSDILAFQVRDGIAFSQEKVQNNQHILTYALQTLSNQELLNRIISCSFIPKFIQLPKTFAEFNNIFTRKKCTLCNHFSKHLLTSLCLICGDTICQSRCEEKEKGNLTRHAAKYHAGQAIFLDIQYPICVIVNGPEGWVSPIKDAYDDFLGENIVNKLEDNANLYDLDFNSFNLNEDFAKLLREVVEEHSMKKTLYNLVQKEGMYYQSGEL